MDRISHRLCIAPMMEWTDRHCRFFHRLITRRARLYTEMVTADAVIHGDRTRLLGFSPEERPVALQLGGSEPEKLARAAAIGEQFGYDEINLNVGCPSDRVQSGRFGACLMAEPTLVAECVRAMRKAASVPVTVKCRIGIDDQDTEQALDAFVDRVADAGCEIFIVHARMAWLEGLSPKENRDIPPLDYDRVYRLKQRRPELTVVINGGIASLDEAEAHLAHVDGMMLGRAAYHDPYMLAEADRHLFSDATPAASRADILRAFIWYTDEQLAQGTRLQSLTRHILGLMHGKPRGRAFRRLLSENAHKPDAGIALLHEAVSLIEGAESRALAAAE